MQPAPEKAFLTREYQADTFVYHIDIVGTCNLGCVSCPVGNMPMTTKSRGVQPRGFMPYARFELILKKILRESPVARPVIGLYNWGEPLLHPDVGRIVRLVREHELYCAVSTNLNQGRFLEDLVQAEPSSIKISVSGFTQGVYGRTHTKGRIEVVKENMHRLRALMDQLGKQIDVFVGYHDYVGNGGEELRAMELLASELGFAVRHKIARLYPLEKVLPLYRDGHPTLMDRPLHDLLLVKPSEWARVAERQGRDRTCMMRTQEMAINYDGSVALCCNVFDYSNNIAEDFLTASHVDLQALKDRASLCGPCMAAGFPASCNLDRHPDIQQIAADASGRVI